MREAEEVKDFPNISFFAYPGVTAGISERVFCAWHLLNDTPAFFIAIKMRTPASNLFEWSSRLYRVFRVFGCTFDNGFLGQSANDLPETSRRFAVIKAAKIPR